MKISLRWLCDHLHTSWDTIDVVKLVADFNTKTAEIESITRYTLDLSDMTLVRVQQQNERDIQTYSPEWNTEIQLLHRTDIQIGSWYLIKKYKDGYQWVSYADVKGAREGLLGAFEVKELEVADGSWRKHIETEDYIFEIDNKSITHRPDLWGHRGIAREVAYYFKSELISEDTLLSMFPSSQACTYKPIIKTDTCSAVSLASITGINYTASLLSIAFRLLRTDMSVHNALVDLTNYVMLDIGHPMHAFDQNNIKGTDFIIRKAHEKESLELLDGASLELQERDIVIADDEHALSLAGIKGGKCSGISSTTRNVLLEAGCFDAGTIRLSSAYHKVRTDASARFEKSMDPYNAKKALQRFLKLCHDFNISYQTISECVSLEPEYKENKIIISHNHIVQALGTAIPSDFVISSLTKIGFIVHAHDDNGVIYDIIVPTFRSTKDISIPEDIVEEVGRLYGYNNLVTDVPYQAKQPTAHSWFDVQYKVKEILAYQARMHEVENYALFDNQWITKIEWPVVNEVVVKYPLSEQRTTLVTSLVPHLLQNVEQNMANHESIAFFEWGRVWHIDTNEIQEEQVVAGIWYNRKQEIDFYACKEHLQVLFDVLGCQIVWKPMEQSTAWSSAHQVALLYHNDRCVGKAGMVSRSMMQHLDAGYAFVFELDGSFFTQYQSPLPTFKSLPKYQTTFLDISVRVASSVTVQQMTHAILKADQRIFDVVLHDSFFKPEWHDSKSLTMRFYIKDEHKTLDKHDIDDVYAHVQNAVKQWEYVQS